MNIADSINPEQCTGCGTCASICPQGCIRMLPDGEGFLSPQIYAQKCIQCGVCVSKCPLRRADREKAPRTVWAAYAKDAAIRKDSSSGGVFSVLAEHTIAQGGVVVGAAFREDFKSVHHICAEDQQELALLRGSKYLQSHLEDTFQRTTQYLKAGRPVLFSGTPCQIAGLKAFLGRDDPNLLTLDVICHGVPSPKAWDTYLTELERKAKALVTSFNFRDKTYGWKNFGLRFGFRNGRETWESQWKNPYFRCFLQDYPLRNSCYDCAFKGSNYDSDITIGDFWGVRHVLPELDYDRGVSVVMSRSAAGAQALECIASELVTYPVEEAQAIAHNQAIIASARKPEKRTEFFAGLDSMSFWKLSDTVSPRTVRQKLAGSIPEGFKQKLKKLRRR